MLAADNVTTPEFQITTDSQIINLTNTLNRSFLGSGNPNGLEFVQQHGSVIFDLSPYMTAPYTVNDTAGLNHLIDKLGDLLTGGQLSVKTKTEIFNYITGSTTVNGKPTPNFLSTASTNTQRPGARDRAVDPDLVGVRYPTLIPPFLVPPSIISYGIR